MSSKQDFHQALEADGIYHLFSRAVGSEKLFYSTENYFYFLSKLKHHCHCVAGIYAYALIPNHFHLLIKVKPEKELIKSFEEMKNVTFDAEKHSLQDFVMKRFSNLLNGYTKAINKMYDRKGSLFMDYLKRTKANNEADFTSFIWYIHKNAVHHGCSKAIGEWNFDSYNSILSDKATSLLRNDIIDFFKNKEQFILFHQQPIDLKTSFSEM